MSGLDEKALGKRLQQVRRDKGFTQQALCQQANLSYSTLAKIERGAIKSPSIFTVQAIAEAMNVSLDELVGRSVSTTMPTITKSKGGVSFVYFDVNDTLVRAAQRGFSILAEQTGVMPEIIERMFWHYNQQLDCGQMSLDDFNRKLGERLEANVDWRQAYLAGAEAISDVQELLLWASQHYRVGLLSNSLPSLIQGLRDQKTLPDVPYTAVIDSSELGVMKPNPEIYAIATECAGVPADEILLIDDTRPNLIAAEQAGWHTALFDGYQAAESVARIKAVLELAG